MPDSAPARDLSYTTPRPDVFAMVPADALTVLDVGCSNGALGAALKAAVSGRRVYGVEGDAGFVQEASTRLDAVFRADLNTFDWAAFGADALFDCIIFADVLEHLVDPRRQLEEARRYLAPNGCIVLSLPNIRHLSALASIFIRGTFPRRDRGIFDRDHLRWFTLKDASVFLRDSGFVDVATTYNLRVGDRGGGLLNKAVDRLLGPVAGMFPVREFLTYQFCVRAVVHDKARTTRHRER